MGEIIWKDITGYEGLYKINQFGDILSLSMWNGHKYKERKKPKKISPTLTTTGYFKVELVKDKKRKTYKIHRLLAIEFIPNNLNKPHINHKDGNKLNNSLDNLEWVTHKENMVHFSENHRKQLISKEDVLKMFELYKNGIYPKEIAEKFNVKEGNVRDYFKKHGIKLKPIKEVLNKYKINRKEMIKMFEENKKTKEIVDYLGGNSVLINTYRYQWRKGVLRFE